jgi:hypothetical protein
VTGPDQRAAKQLTEMRKRHAKALQPDIDKLEQRLGSGLMGKAAVAKKKRKQMLDDL